MKNGFRGFLFGLGTGIIALSLIFYCIYSFSFKKTIESAANAEPAAMTAEEIEKEAAAMGMIYPKSLPEKSGEDIAEMTDAQIIARAKELGMGFDDGTDSGETAEPVAGDTGGPEYMDIDIPYGSSSGEIAELLRKNGIVDNADSFIEFTMVKGVSRQLAGGLLKFPKDADYEEVLRILLGR